MSEITDPVAIWAGMIVQEGKTAALEIADTAGTEAALDAMNFIAENRQKQMAVYRARLNSLAPLVAACGDGEHPETAWDHDALVKLAEGVRLALASPSKDVTEPEEGR